MGVAPLTVRRLQRGATCFSIAIMPIRVVVSCTRTMPVEVGGQQFFTNNEVSEQLSVSRQTLWRWREKGRIPPGVRYRTRQVLFTADEVMAIREYANKLEPIEFRGTRQLGLFRRIRTEGVAQ